MMMVDTDLSASPRSCYGPAPHKGLVRGRGHLTRPEPVEGRARGPEGLRIVLIRHGETDWNREEIFRGRADVPLNSNGREQARAIARALEEMPIRAVYSSPLLRALETASIIAEPRGLGVQHVDGLTDFDYGEWQGLPHQDVERRYAGEYALWQNSPHLVRPAGGESLDEVRARALKALDRIATSQRNGAAAVVSHRVVNKVLLCGILGLSNSHFWQIRQDNSCINILQYAGGGYVVRLLNDTCHLRGVKGGVVAADF